VGDVENAGVETSARFCRGGKCTWQRSWMNLCSLLTYVAIFSLALGTDALDQVKQQLTGHGLNAAWQWLVVNVLWEEVDSQREITQRQTLTHVMDQVSQCTVRQRPATTSITPHTSDYFQVNSASYPQWDGKLSSSWRATGWRPSAADCGGGMSASCTPGVQLFADVDNGWPHICAAVLLGHANQLPLPRL